jgi:hypothetical protein
MAETGKSMLYGAVAGMAGGLAMSVIRQALQEAGLMGAPLPLKIERRLERRAGVDDWTGSGEEKVLAMGEHLAVSAAFGAAYPLLGRALTVPAWMVGLVYGAFVYGVLILGIGPALDLARPRWRDEPGAAARRLGVHLIFGVVTAVVFQRLDRSA